jgi:beta-galactosidase/beta-glucuronidase
MREQNLGGKWQFRQAGSAKWLPALVPGGVHTDLLALGRIPDPFFADNELRVQWVAESDWNTARFFRLMQKNAPGKKLSSYAKASTRSRRSPSTANRWENPTTNSAPGALR